MKPPIISSMNRLVRKAITIAPMVAANPRLLPLMRNGVHPEHYTRLNVKWLKAPIAFVYSYIIKAGFRDGRAGLHYALAKAFYWQIELKMSEMKRTSERITDG